MRPDPGSARDRLVAVLRLAYSGERAAAFAYRGHARSVSDPDIRERITTIDAEELRHRREVGAMLAALGGKPSRRREMQATLVGRVLGALCHVSGSFVPMYGAGRLESRNIREYEDAARFARDSGHAEFVDALLTMAEVEWEHEQYFRACVLAHPWARWVRPWPPPAAKHTIRAAFTAGVRPEPGRARLAASR